MPVHIDGTSAAHMVVSVITITSHESRSRRASSSAAKFADPDSSSPSIRSLSVTGGASRPPGARQACAARAWKRTWPLSSEAPRASSWPSRCTGSNGGESHSSSGSTGCTSWWPYTSTVGADGSADGHCANTAGKPLSSAPVSQTSATGNPARRRCSASHCADRRTSPLCSGSADTEGMVSHCMSASKKSAAFSLM